MRALPAAGGEATFYLVQVLMVWGFVSCHRLRRGPVGGGGVFVSGVHHLQPLHPDARMPALTSIPPPRCSPPPQPVSTVSLDLIEVRHVMHWPVVTLQVGGWYCRSLQGTADSWP